MNFLVSNVSPSIEKLPDGYLILKPVLGCETIDMIGFTLTDSLPSYIQWFGDLCH